MRGHLVVRARGDLASRRGSGYLALSSSACHTAAAASSACLGSFFPVTASWKLIFSVSTSFPASGRDGLEKIVPRILIGEVGDVLEHGIAASLQ